MATTTRSAGRQPDVDATSYVLDVGVQVTSGYTGSHTDFINARAIIPDNGGSFAARECLRVTPRVYGIYKVAD